MSLSGEPSTTDQTAVADGPGSLAINAASYASVTVYQYITRDGADVSARGTSDPSICPYPGLETFRISEAKFFAGRQADIARLEDKLAEHGICGVIAASGAGKSSLVHAGLIPDLADRENEAWDIFAFKPGQRPLYELARSLSGVLANGKNLDAQREEIKGYAVSLQDEPGALSDYLEFIRQRRRSTTAGRCHRVLIFVDQWEELYTRTDEKERDVLARELLDVVERGLAQVIVTMRIDFMKEMLEFSTEFFRRLKPGIHYVEPMDEISLRSAIESPANEVGLGVPQELTSRLIADLGHGRNHRSLPYLQFVLRQLWEARDRQTNSLTTEAYNGMKGLKGAIGAHADAVFRKLPKTEQGLARLVLPRLANVSETGEATSRRLPFADFDEPARKLLRKLAEPKRRLIVLSSATQDVAEAEIVAEIAHEALLDDWKTLAGWIADRKLFFRIRDKLEADTKTWVDNGRNHEFLIPPGKPLLDAQDLQASAQSGDTSEDLNDFIEKSVAKRKRDDAARRQDDENQIRKLRIRNRGLMALTAFFMAAAIVAGLFWKEAQKSAHAESLARFQSEVRLVGSLATLGTPDAWDLLAAATRDYAESVGRSSAYDAMNADVLTVALSTLVNQRVFQPEELQGGSSEIIQFTPDGSSLIVAQDRDLLIIDARTTETTARSNDLGLPLLHNSLGGDWVGLIVCANPPCILQEVLFSEEDSFDEFYANYIGREETEISESERKAAWSLRSDFLELLRHDVSREKLIFAILDAPAGEIYSAKLSQCGTDFCFGKDSLGEVPLELLEEKFRDSVDEWNELAFRLPLTIDERGEAIFVTPRELPQPFELDPNIASVRQVIGADGTVVRASFKSATIEVFHKSEDSSWQRSSHCLEYDWEQFCTGGENGAFVLDISNDGRLILVTSINSGTGGGSGLHQTVLIETETSRVLWRSETVSSKGAIAPDGSSFAVVNWLGELEIRSAYDSSLVYNHAELVYHEFWGNRSAIAYHPYLPLAATLQANGDVVLLDLTQSRSLTMNTSPLPSMRSACRPTNRGPFRSILAATPRPLNSSDWSVTRTATDDVDGFSMRLPASDEPTSSLVSAVILDGTFVVNDGNRSVEIPEWSLLMGDAAPDFSVADHLRVNLSASGDALVIWPDERMLLDDSHLGKARWAMLLNLGGVWSVVRTGVLDEPFDWKARVAFALGGGVEPIYVTNRDRCFVEARLVKTDELIWSEPLAFSNDVDFHIDIAHGVVLARSTEWYGAVALQVFDLHTGAPGPWLNVSNYDNGGRFTSIEGGVRVRVPPWGDRLRRLLLDGSGATE